MGICGANASKVTDKGNIDVKMQYVYLGRSGLKVSKLCYANLVRHKLKKEDANMTDRCVKYCYDKGVNYFNTAEVDSEGKGEKQMACALKKLNCHRDELVIATNVYWGKEIPEASTKEHIMESISNSQKLLDMEYVDMVFLHRYDNKTPLKETLVAMKEMLDSGKVHYWGTSEWPAVRIMQAMHMCDELKMARPIAEQCEYNMLVRQKMEVDYAALFDDYGLATTIWSPMKSGVLTGIYNAGIPENSRLAYDETTKGFYNQYFGKNVRDQTLKMLNDLSAIAKGQKMTMGQLALAWALEYKNTTSCVIRADNLEQLEENFKCLTLKDKLTPKFFKKINDTLNNTPMPDIDYKIFQPIPNRR